MANENDTNWEETNYTEENEEQTSVNYDDDSIDEDESGDRLELSGNGQGKKRQMAILLFLIIVLVIIGLFLILRIVGNSANRGESQNTVPSAVEVSDNQDLQSDLTSSFFDESSDKTADLMSVGFNENGEATIVDTGNQDNPAATVADVAPADGIKADDLFSASEAEAKKADEKVNKAEAKENAVKEAEEKDSAKESNKGRANNSIMVAWNKTVRQNPFKPPVINRAYEDKYDKMDGMQFEIIEPPTKLVPDRNIEKLLQTQISGILYDENSPSAIVNLAGRDEFVKVGDEISGYKIKKITRNKVEISYKNNTYVASVGELFVPGKLESQPAVANLSNKFAGRYKQEDVEE